MQKKETSEAPPPTNCALFPPFLIIIKQQQNINIQKNILPLPHHFLTKYQYLKTIQSNAKMIYTIFKKSIK
jgi:hypothetical protein